MSEPKRNSLKKKHWSIKQHETLIVRNSEGNFCLNIEGGAENGSFPVIGEIRQERICYRSGKLQQGELVLEVNHKRVAGMIKRDVIALIKRSADPLTLITVKQNPTITRDLRQYLGTRFTKNSVDSELQHQIRENLHMRVVPCTTRPPNPGERHSIDYSFISVEEFKRMEKNGELLESGTYEGNYYGTPRPPCDPPTTTLNPPILRSPASMGYKPQGMTLMEAESLSPPSRSYSAPAGSNSNINVQALGPLPSNWEIAYTEDNQKYFIDHNTETTHWLDPRLMRQLHHDPLECAEEELPYGWEKVNDPIYGIYYIDHINRRTQYDNPVIDAKRKFAGAQLPVRNMFEHPSPPPMRQPPSFASAAALEKQREAYAAQQWPNAGLQDTFDTHYPPSYNEEEALENELQGETIYVTLMKNSQGFGFTIIGGDHPGELLQVKSIVPGSIAAREGRLRIGDVLVRINGTSVLTCTHRDVVSLFQSLPLHSSVTLELRRGYPLPNTRLDESLPGYDQYRYYRASDSNQMLMDQGYDSRSNDVMAPRGRNSQERAEILTVNIIKGPLGFGFTLGECVEGHNVKQILDHPRCAQMREQDLILEVNGEKVKNYSHTDLVNVLKRCPKGNQTTFVIQRGPSSEVDKNEFHQLPNESYSYNNNTNYYLNSTDSEPFSTLEVTLSRHTSGFGFRIIGGREEGSQATLGAIVAGGAADLDGRLQVGDEITHINAQSVIDATHHEVIGLMSQAGTLGSVSLRIQRKMPSTEPVRSASPSMISGAELHSDFNTSNMMDSNRMRGPPMGVRDVVINRPTSEMSFGFVLQSNTKRRGCSICRMVPDSPAEKSCQLFIGDHLLAVNNQDVSSMDHGDIVGLIKRSGLNIRLLVQQPHDEGDVIEAREVGAQLPAMQSAVATPLDTTNKPKSLSNHHGSGQNNTAYPQQNRSISYSGGNEDQFNNSFTGSSGGMPYFGKSHHDDGDQPPLISGDLDDISSQDEEIHHIEIKRDHTGFGFSIRGGAEYGTPLYVLRIAPGGAAEKDCRLRAGDELLEINGNNTEGLLHSDAITIIKHGGGVAKLIIRRGPDDSYTDGFYPSSNETDMMRQMSLNDYPSEQQQRYPPGNHNYPPMMMNRDYQT